MRPLSRYELRSYWFAALSLLACFFGAGVAQAAGAPDYLRDVRPILADHCFTCHGPDGAARQAGLRLDRAGDALAPLESGLTVIRPGQANDSELVKRIESADPAVVMPPPETKKQLSTEQKAILRQWIDAGASYSEHWSYRAPVRPALPTVSEQGWPRNSIDSFVLANIESAGVGPSPEANRTTLIRRLSLDLTGLPPAIEEVDAFLADDSPDAYERLVDRLLASPHYGEKLAQDWLDLARFGDSSGYQDDGDRPNHPYRDYVIGAFNANLPFDRFTVENLAGDLLPSATVAQRVASGFNRLHRHNEEGGSDPDEFQVVYAVDRTNTLAAAWMGITLGCAQCHDHKYDPISQREYYQLYAFFNSLQGEVVISKAPSPPQVRVPSAIDGGRVERIAAEIAAARQDEKRLEAKAETEFETWLAAHENAVVANDPPAIKMGAAGGVIARSSHAAFYADARLDGPLSLDQPLEARGRVAMIRSVNNIVDIGHFSAQLSSQKKSASIGMMAAEGPRYFACLVLPTGERIMSPPIAGEHGVDYAWSYRYEPAGGPDDPADADSAGEGLLTLTLVRDGAPIGAVSIDLTAQQRAIASTFDAFGMRYDGAGDADTPLELFIDDVEYATSASGTSRTQTFDTDPKWQGVGNFESGHSFGFDPLATTANGASGLSLEQILALPEERRTPRHMTRLRELFTTEKLPELRAVQVRIAALGAERERIENSAPLAFVWEEMKTPRPSRILARGDYRSPGETVERDVPAIFPQLLGEAPPDRLDLARWLVGRDHPLTARVAVNRYWKQCFGAGLVRTPEDFGVRGEPPTHPELFDWLAVEFSEDWDIKRLLRTIVTSSTYRQSSAVAPRLRELDPGNRLLARGARFRLSAEEIRDASLAAAGLLSRRIGGRSVYPYQPDHFYRDKEDDPGEWKWPLETGGELYRRGLYTFLRRTTPYPSQQTFDAPSRGECTVARSRTSTPLQALVTLNDPVFVEAARVLAERIVMNEGDDSARLTFACRSVLSRPPTNRERQVLEELFQQSRERYLRDRESALAISASGAAPRQTNVDPVEVAAWSAVASALMNLDEAITRE